MQCKPTGSSKLLMRVYEMLVLIILIILFSVLNRLMLGVMLTTSFLSMWISNTATTAMMVPIVEAVLGEIKNESIKNRLEKGENENGQADEVGT